MGVSTVRGACMLHASRISCHSLQLWWQCSQDSNGFCPIHIVQATFISSATVLGIAFHAVLACPAISSCRIVQQSCTSGRRSSFQCTTQRAILSLFQHASLSWRSADRGKATSCLPTRWKTSSRDSIHQDHELSLNNSLPGSCPCVDRRSRQRWSRPVDRSRRPGCT